MKYLQFSEIVLINRRMISEWGGYSESEDNLLNPGSLEYVLDAIQGSLFGQDRYPTLIDKAAAVAWYVITGHVFHNGNKRTGMGACRSLLEANGYTMRIDWEVKDIAFRIAEGQLSFPELVDWLERRVEPVNEANPARLTSSL